MKKTIQKRGYHGRFSGKAGNGRKAVKRCVSFDPDLFDALKDYAGLYCGGNISEAIFDCLDKALNDTVFWDDAAERKQAEQAASAANTTTTNAPITTTARDDSPTVIGNGNTTTIVKKNGGKPSRPAKRRK